MKMTPAVQDFILHWGEMGTRWGVNRSVAQIHALLHLSPKPLPAEEIADTLGLARSNVSTGLKELQGWKLVRVSRELGDRRDHFMAEKDMVEVVRLVVEGRRSREFQPTIEAVAKAHEEASSDSETPAEIAQRMEETLEIMRMFDDWYAEIAKLPQGSQMALLKIGAGIARFLPKGG